MSFTKITDTLNVHQARADRPTESASVLKVLFDTDVNTIKTRFNAFVDETASVVDGSSGADNVSITQVSAFTSASVQAILEEINTRITAVTDSASGADYIGSTAVTGVTGATVQSQIESIKSLIDTANGLITDGSNALTTHKTSSDHDSRYYTETEVDALDVANVKLTGVQTVAGVKTFSSSPIVPVPTTDLQASTKKYVDDSVTTLDTDLQGQITTDVAALATHKTSADHDSRYYSETEIDSNIYTKTQVQTSGSSSVHWDNLTNVPPLADNSWQPPVADLTALAAVTGMSDGDLRVVLDIDVVYTYDLTTTAWVVIGASGSGISDHGSLVGLGDDDHAQYLRTDGSRDLTGNQSFAGFESKNMLVEKLATAPTSAEARLWYDTANHQLKIYNGTSWVNTTGVGSVKQDIEIVATAGQTAFDISIGSTQSYDINVNLMNVYLKNANGYYELLDADSYTETDSETITLLAGATLNDEYYFKWTKNVASVVNSIVDGAITNAKLASDIKVGSLTTLTTASKASAVGAINEVDAKGLVDDTTPELGGELDAGSHTIGFTEYDNGNSSTADTIDWKLSNKQKSALTGNCTFTFTAPSNPCSLLLKLTQDGTGSRTATWPATVKWPGGTAPTLTTTASAIDIISFYWDGTNYYGMSSLAFS